MKCVQKHSEHNSVHIQGNVNDMDVADRNSIVNQFFSVVSEVLLPIQFDFIWAFRQLSRSQLLMHCTNLLLSQQHSVNSSRADNEFS